METHISTPNGQDMLPVSHPLSPDSAIGTNPPPSPDDFISKPEVVVNETTQSVENNSREASVLSAQEYEHETEEKQLLEKNEIDDNKQQNQGDDDDDYDDSVSESEMVITGSMQFALTPTAVASLEHDVQSGSPVVESTISDVDTLSKCINNSNNDVLVSGGTFDDKSSPDGDDARHNSNYNSDSPLANVNTKDIETNTIAAVGNGGSSCTNFQDVSAVCEPSMSVATDNLKKGKNTNSVQQNVVDIDNSSNHNSCKNSSQGPTSKAEDSDSSPAFSQPSPPAKVKRLRRHSSGVANLPTTVAHLVGPNGVDVYVVGTAHFSLESQSDVVTTIERVRPDIVVLELCRARTAILSLDEQAIIEESSNMDFAKMRTVLNQHGRVQGVLYLLLLSVSAHITRQLGMAPGGEFRVAVSAVKKFVPKASIQLGDRPINVTLGRALAALSPWSKLKLAFHIITTSDPISKEDVEKCKDKDMIEELLAEMTGQFPAISEVFVRERDQYLAHSIYRACKPMPVTGSSGPCRVVGVVGIGHLRGIQDHWGKVDKQTINNILVIPPPSAANRAVSFACRAAVWSVAAYAGYRLFLRCRGPASTAAAAVFAAVASAAPSTSDLFKRGGGTGEL